MRAEIERRVKEQVEAELRARMAALPPAAAAPRAETPASPAAAEAALGLAPDRIRELQQHLRALGHDPRGVDGNLGTGTRAAIRAFQKSRGMAETGFVSGELLKAVDDARAPAVAAVRPPSVPGPPSSVQPAVGVYPSQPRIQPISFRDCPECPEMVVIPAGSTRLASGLDVTIAAPFAVGKFEVTFEEWDTCVAAGGFFGGGCSHRPDDRGWGRGRQPTMGVNWNDAQQYVAWLSLKTGKSYRLLSESEWEYAAQFGSGREQTVQPGANEANCNGCGSRWDNKQAAPVGSFAANSFGVHDLLGNVSEWTADCWSQGYLRAASDGSASRTGNCSWRVVRGGSWNMDSGFPRSAHRLRIPSDLRVSYVGFRVARTL
jgi:formylglycine-generating enzyme required for sulfatase activity